MKLNDEQFNALAPFEDKYFNKALDAKWTPTPSSAELELMNSTYEALSGKPRRLNRGCQQCIFRLVSDVAMIFRADKQERETSSTATDGKPKRTRKK